MIKTDTTIHFDDLSEWLTRVATDSDPKGASHREGRSDNEWAGGSWAEVNRIAREGWPEGYEAIRATTAAIFRRVSQRIPTPETVFHVTPTSGVIDMGRLMEGEPECWIEQEDTEQVITGQSPKVARIVVNNSASCNVPTHVIFTRGAAIVALAEALELTGRTVEISIANAVSAGRGGGEELAMVTCVVKPFTSRANWGLMAFVLAHPGMLRRLIFAAQEMLPPDTRRKFGFSVTGSYGIPADPSEGDKGDIYLPKAHGAEPQWKSPEAAEKWVLDALQAQGVMLAD